MPEITCLVVSHNKPDYIKEAVNSLLAQRFQEWQAVLVDSGVLYDAGFFTWIQDPRIELVRSKETQEIRSTRAPAPWCFNECFRHGLVKGKLVTYLCDDDVWYDNAFEVFVTYWKHHPEAEAMYASQDVSIHVNGHRYTIGERRAVHVMGHAAGRYLDCVVDYLQFCHTLKVLDKLRGDYWPEHKITETHADGVFMDRVGAVTPIHPIDIKIGQNRRTPKSTYKPS